VTPLAVDHRGHGPLAVVMLHGIGGGKTLWDDAHSGTLAALASAGYTALAMDLPGYGASAAPAEDSIAGMARAVDDTLAALGVKDAALVGHSMGGMVALEMALSCPGRVRGLVLACTSAAFGPPGGDWQQAFLRDRLGVLEAAGSMRAMAQSLVPTLLGDGPRAEAAEQAVEVMSRVPEATYRRALQALAGFDRRAGLAQVWVPALCLAAGRDRTAPPEVLSRMAARLPHGEYAVVEGAGHLGPVERPGEFNARILQFLAARLT